MQKKEMPAIRATSNSILPLAFQLVFQPIILSFCAIFVSHFGGEFMGTFGLYNGDMVISSGCIDIVILQFHLLFGFRSVLGLFDGFNGFSCSLCV